MNKKDSSSESDSTETSMRVYYTSSQTIVSFVTGTTIVSIAARW